MFQFDDFIVEVPDHFIQLSCCADSDSFKFVFSFGSGTFIFALSSVAFIFVLFFRENDLVLQHTLLAVIAVVAIFIDHDDGVCACENTHAQRVVVVAQVHEVRDVGAARCTVNAVVVHFAVDSLDGHRVLAVGALHSGVVVCVLEFDEAKFNECCMT